MTVPAASATPIEVRLCFTSQYLLGAAVTVDSFRRHNEWFRGRIVAYCTAEEASRMGNGLRAAGFDDVRTVPAALLDAIDEGCPGDGWVRARFHSLAMLADRVEAPALLLDADLLVLASCEPLAEIPGRVVACGEGAFYRGDAVDRITNAFVRGQAGPDAIERTFNSGLMRIAGDVLGPDLFDRALSLLSAERMGRLERRQHDQFILNRLFEGMWEPADASFNFLLKHAPLIQERTGVGLREARVVHFNRAPRPWEFDTVLDAATPTQARARSLWLHGLAQVVESSSLRAISTEA